MRRATLALLVSACLVQAQAVDPTAQALRVLQPEGSPAAGLAKLKAPAPEIAAFLDARAADLGAGRREPFKSTLLKLTASKDPTEQMWALARLVEAGDLDHYDAYAQAMLRHVQGTVQARPQRLDYTYRPAQQVLGKGAPESTTLAPASDFWKVLQSTLETDPEAKVDESLYAVWCFNTQAVQRDLVRRVASRIARPASPVNPRADPWNDPRFWIVMDWAIVWGGPEDFAHLQQIIQDPRAREEFRRRTEELRRVQAYLPCLLANGPEAPGEPPSPAMDRALEVVKLLATTLPFALDFSEMKVRSRSTLPAYPSEAKMRRLKGDLAVEITTDTQGSPCRVRMVPGPFLAFFAPTCLKFAESWRFEPAKVNGVPVASRFLLTMPFRLR